MTTTDTAMSRTRQLETVVLNRDVPARRVPFGDEVVIPEGTSVRITQELGGSFTVDIGGSLARIEGSEADALGKEPQASGPALPEAASDAEVEKAVWDRLHTCYDPEIPFDIVELGLIYSCELKAREEGGRSVDIEMTLTAPGCGMGPVLVDEVKTKLLALPTVEEANVELVFDPPWSPERMSEAARLQTGML